MSLCLVMALNAGSGIRGSRSSVETETGNLS
jgi:hypothetical protein